MEGVEPPNPGRDGSVRRTTRLAWTLWLAFALVLSIVVARKSLDGKHSVVPAYRAASAAWLQSQPIYELSSVHGFLYLPSSAVITAPLALLPPAAHEFAFRWISIALLAWAVFRLSQLLPPPCSHHAFLLLSVCAIATAAGPGRAGQMNLPLAATMTLAVVEAMKQRWWPSAFWIGLGFALKPQAIVLGLLLIATCPPLRVKGLVALVVALLLPFLFQSPSYVVQQYSLCAQKLSISGRPSEVGVHNNDLTGLFGAIGFEPAENIRWLARAVAALATLAACGLAVRRRPPGVALLLTLAFAAVYTVLFNPRTEGGSYVVVAIPLAALLAREIARPKPLRAALLVVIAFGWTLSYVLSQWLWSIAHAAGLSVAPTFRGGFAPYWLSPLLALSFLTYLVTELRSRSEVAPEPGE